MMGAPENWKWYKLYPGLPGGGLETPLQSFAPGPTPPVGGTDKYCMSLTMCFTSTNTCTERANFLLHSSRYK